MKVILNIIISLCLLLTIGCGRFFSSNDEPNFINGIEITDTNDYGNLYGYRLSIIDPDSLFHLPNYDIQLENGLLTAGIFYFGGCKEYPFYPKGFFEQNNLIMWFNHDSNNDVCRSTINEVISIDLADVKFDSLFLRSTVDSSRIYVR